MAAGSGAGVGKVADTAALGASVTIVGPFGTSGAVGKLKQTVTPLVPEHVVPRGALEPDLA